MFDYLNKVCDLIIECTEIAAGLNVPRHQYGQQLLLLRKLGHIATELKKAVALITGVRDGN